MCCANKKKKKKNSGGFHKTLPGKAYESYVSFCRIPKISTLPKMVSKVKASPGVTSKEKFSPVGVQRDTPQS